MNNALKKPYCIYNLKIKGPGENIICENSGSKKLNSPYSLALIIFILGVPALVPGNSWITYTIFFLSDIDNTYKIVYIRCQYRKNNYYEI